LNYQGDHFSIAALYPEGTIISGGLSKWCGAGGWRLGTFTFPPSLRKLQESMAVAASETFTSTSAPIQYAAITAFNKGPEIDRYLAGVRKILKTLGTHLAGRFQEAGLRTPVPLGGFYLFPDFEDCRQALNRRNIYTDVQLCDRLLEETGIATLPGSNFGRPLEELTIRISYVNFDGEKALEALLSEYGYKHPDPQFLEKYCKHVIEAQEKLCDWVISL
jgi:aspartate aminotransferase